MTEKPDSSADIDVKVVTNKFGKILVCKFPYNPYIIEVVKNSDWNETHRKFDSKDKSWTIDYSWKSLSAILSKFSDDVESKHYKAFFQKLNELRNELNPTEQKKNDSDKFFESIIPSNSVKVLEYTRDYNKWNGTTYILKITSLDKSKGDFPILQLFYNRKASRKAKEKYGRSSADPFGMLSDFFGLPHNDFKEILDSDNIYAIIQEIQELFAQEGTRSIKFSSFKQIDEKTKEARLRVFNISTDRHITVTFNEIRDIVQKEVGSVVTEENLGGGVCWRYNLFTKNLEKEEFLASLLITSGNNVKKTSMKVVGLIKVGSCSNSIIAFERVGIKHTENWQERLVSAIKEAVAVINNSMQVIEFAMKREITLDEGLTMIDSMDFGLKDADKIIYIRNLVKTRFELEFKTKKNFWAVSQSLSYVGTHDEEVNDDNDISDATFDRLKEESFAVISSIYSQPNQISQEEFHF